MKSRFALAAFALLLGFAACNKTEPENTDLNNDQTQTEDVESTPIVFTVTGLNSTATTATTSTRSTVDNDWYGVDSVGVQVNGAVKGYAVTSEYPYTEATLSSDDPHYWSASFEDITVTAWWPYTEGETSPPDVVVKADQSELENFEASDFISVENKTVSYRDPTLEFSHRTARITVNLTIDDGNSQDNIANGTVKLTSLSYIEDSNIITAYKYFDDNENKYIYEALAAPQNVAENKPLIHIVIGSNTYTYSTSDELTLEANKRYTYKLKVSASGLTFEGSTIGGWESGNNDETFEVEDQGYTYDSNSKTYTVYNANGLEYVAGLVNGGQTSINITLTADINMTGTTWTPVGNNSNRYTGTFEGGGYTIKGLTIDQDETNYVGLIGYLGEGGKVQNLKLDNVNITGYNWVGGVVGENYGTVTNCTTSGSVSGNESVGGVVGTNSNTVTYCSTSSSVSGDHYVGGVVGYNNSGTMTSCTASGSVDSSGYGYVGGVVGYNNSGTMTSCTASGSVDGNVYVGGMAGYNYGIVTDCYASGNVSGSANVGGVIGENHSTVIACTASGSVNGSGYYVGGVVGWNYGTVTACYHASGSVSGYAYVGGVVGFNVSTMTACYAWSSVSGYAYVGGVVGWNSSTVTACYWDGYDGDGIGYNDGGSGDVTEVTDGVTWSTAVDGMNQALQSYDWQYEYHSENTLPTLTLKTNQ